MIGRLTLHMGAHQDFGIRYENLMGINATYASVINPIGRLGPMQVPVAVGLRKGSNFWFDE